MTIVTGLDSTRCRLQQVHVCVIKLCHQAWPCMVPAGPTSMRTVPHQLASAFVSGYTGQRFPTTNIAVPIQTLSWAGVVVVCAWRL